MEEQQPQKGMDEMNTVKLQGIGNTTAIEAKDLKVGDVTVWNYGSLETITSVEFSKTGKTLSVGIEYFDSFHKKNVQSTRKFSAPRLVAVRR